MDSFLYPNGKKNMCNIVNRQPPMNAAPMQFTSEDASRIQADLIHSQTEYMIRQEQTQELVKREEIKKQVFLEKEYAKLELHEMVKDVRELRTFSVVKDEYGRIYLAIRRPQCRQYAQQMFIADELIDAKRYVTYYPEKEKRLLLIFRRNGIEQYVCYKPKPNGKNGKGLILKLEEAGIYPKISRRLKNDASDALYAFLCENSKEEEIATRYGFNLSSDNVWYFCEPNEINLEVIDHERE